MRLITIDADDFESKLESSCNTEQESMAFVNFLAYLDEQPQIEIEPAQNRIITARYTYEVDKNNHSKLICGFGDGTEKVFHFCADNPMPKEYVVQDLTWEQLQGLCIGMWRMAIGEFIKINK